MLDNIDIEQGLSDNQYSYKSLVSTIKISQGMLVLIIASCESGSFQNELIDRYETELASSIPSYRVKLDRSEPSLRAALEELVNDRSELKQPKVPAVITVTGAANLLSIRMGITEINSALDRFFGYLQWTREGLREFPYPIVLWVTPKILNQISVKAPDFWSWRGGVFRFTAPVTAITNFISDYSDNHLLFRSFIHDWKSDLLLEDLIDQITQIEKKNQISPALAILFDRVGEAYLSRIEGTYLENWEQASEYFQKAIAIQKMLNLKGDRADTLIKLGSLYDSLGRFKQVKFFDLGIDCYQESLIIFKDLSNRSGESKSLMGLGNIYCFLNRCDEAMEYYQQSLIIFRELGDRDGEGKSLLGLGVVYHLYHRWDEAIDCYQQSLTIFRELGNRYGESGTLNNLGNVYHSQRECDEAINCYQQSLAIFRELGNRYGEGKSLNNLGNVYQSQQQLDEAIDCYQQSSAIFRELGDRYEEDISLRNLDLMYESHP
jgi:tetratricopeptide (TPR) repeat protein